MPTRSAPPSVDRLEAGLSRWTGELVAPQEGRRASWTELDRVRRSWQGGADEALTRPYVATAFDVTSAAAAASLLLLWASGYAPVPLDLRLDAAGIAARLRLVRPRWLLADRRRTELVGAAVRLAGLREDAVAWVGDDPSGWSRALRLPVRTVGPAEPGLVVFTSGTTGVAKGVVLTRGGLVAVADAVADAQRLTARDRVLNALSFAHVNAPVVALLATVLSDGVVVLLRRFDPDGFWRLAEAHGATWGNLAPPLVATLLRRWEYASFGASAPLRFVRTASAPLPVPTARAFEAAFGVAVVESYGISEAASQVTINDVPPGPRRHGWVGWPRAAELRIVDELNRDLPPGTPGEVLVRGPGVMAGYLDDPAATAAAFRDGWLATGDVGELDETGALRLVGRRSDLINRGGEKVAPRAVEEALLGHGRVADCAVVGVPHPVYGQEVAAFVVPRDGCTISEREVRAFARAVLPRHMRPRTVVVVDDLPRSPSGKLARRELAEAAGRVG
jgi:acyl-CoA synthetase (AMP-forming)/AMP-acid ligase II